MTTYVQKHLMIISLPHINNNQLVIIVNNPNNNNKITEATNDL